nr:sporulation integral membrane protein YtvI [uncultured Leptotrichia sp.]
MASYKSFDFKKLYFIVYIALVLLVVFIGFKLGLFLFPFLLGLIFSILTQPFANFLKKRLNFSHKLATIISIVLFLGIFLGSIVLASLKLFEEIYKLSNSLDHYSEEAKNLWNHSVDVVYSYLGQLPEGFTNEAKNIINGFISKGARQAGLFINKLIGFITSIPTLILYTCIMILSTFFISLDKTQIVSFLEKQFPRIWLEKIYNIKREMFTVLGSYIKAQLILMTLCFFELLTLLNLLSFLKFNVHYPLLMSIVICIIDALPILGAGAILLPWVVLEILLGDFKLAIGILIVYFIVLSVRQMLEPKLISENIGVHPLITLISMYSGFKLLGVSGFLVGPVVMIILKNVFSKELEIGFFKEIFDDFVTHDKNSDKGKDEKKDINDNIPENLKKEFIEDKKC